MGLEMQEDFFSSYLESRFFRVTPSQLVFSRRHDKPDVPKVLIVESTCDAKKQLYVEAVSSAPDFIAASKGCGVIYRGQTTEMKVYPKALAFATRSLEPMHVSILIENARIDVPIKFVE